MYKCKYCNKRIWLTNYWCMNCLEILVNNLTKNKEKKIMKMCKDCKENFNWPNCKNCFKNPNIKEIDEEIDELIIWEN